MYLHDIFLYQPCDLIVTYIENVTDRHRVQTRRNLKPLSTKVEPF